MNAPTTAPIKETRLPFAGKACVAAPILAFVLSLAFSAAPMTAATVPVGLLRILLLMVGFTFAFAALFGTRRHGSQRLARYGRAGLIINGTYLFLTTVLFPGTLASTQAYLAHQRSNAITVSARESAVRRGKDAGMIQYTNIDFSKPGDALAAAATASHGRAGEDVAVLRAWSGVLTQLLAARLEVERASQALTAADVLNPSTITNGSRTALGDQFIERRVVANRYGSALHRWEHALTGLRQRYAEEMKQQQVPPERIALEGEALAAAAGSRIKPLIKLCVAEQQVANLYNRAVSAMESCHPFNHPPVSDSGSNPEIGFLGKDFTAELTRLQQAQQTAVDLRQQLGGR